MLPNTNFYFVSLICFASGVRTRHRAKSVGNASGPGQGISVMRPSSGHCPPRALASRPTQRTRTAPETTATRIAPTSSGMLLDSTTSIWDIRSRVCQIWVAKGNNSNSRDWVSCVMQIARRVMSTREGFGRWGRRAGWPPRFTRMREAVLVSLASSGMCLAGHGYSPVTTTTSSFLRIT